MTAIRPTIPTGVLVALVLLAGCSDRRPDAASSAASPGDSAFAAVQARGADARGMGVDQATSVHRFDALADGGRIELRLFPFDAPTNATGARSSVATTRRRTELFATVASTSCGVAVSNTSCTPAESSFNGNSTTEVGWASVIDFV